MAVTPDSDFSPIKKEIFQLHSKFPQFFDHSSNEEDVFKPAIDSLTNTSSTINDEEVRNWLSNCFPKTITKVYTHETPSDFLSNYFVHYLV